MKADPKAAVTWYQHAADLGNAEGRFNLAGCYRRGSGVQRDVTRAIEIYLSLVATDDEFSMLALGEIYETGDGVPADRAKAISFYQRAAVSGLVDARKALKRLESK